MICALSNRLFIQLFNVLAIILVSLEYQIHLTKDDKNNCNSTHLSTEDDEVEYNKLKFNSFKCLAGVSSRGS